MSVAEAIALWRGGRQQEACLLCESAASAGDLQALSVLGEFYTGLQRPQDAARVLSRLTQLGADASVWRRLGNAQQASGDYAGAAISYRQSLKLEPQNVRAHNNLGQVLMLAGEPAGAQESYERAIALQPGYAIAQNNLGIVHHHRGAFTQAVECYESAVQLQPGFAQAHYNCARSLLQLNHPARALGHLDRALAQQPNVAETHFVRGNALQVLDRPEAALASYDRTLQLDPNHAESLANSSSVLLKLKRPVEARVRSQRALLLRPEFPEALSNLGGALYALHDYPAALEACNKALQLDPGAARSWSNLASVMQPYAEWDRVAEYCEQAIRLQPGLSEAYELLATSHLCRKRPADAVGTFVTLAGLRPGRDGLAGAMRNARLQACDWSEHAREIIALEAAVLRAAERGGFAVQPFNFLAMSESPALQLASARSYVATQFPARWSESSGEFAPRRPGRIRIAYVSADFHDHATGILMAGLIEQHDRGRFEVFGVSHGPDSQDRMRERLQQGFEHFIHARAMDDAQVVRSMRELDIDIAIDLKGHTGENRLGMFARRLAPLQISYLGYPGTTAVPNMDYVLADPIVLPAEHEPFYTEAIIRLPDCYQSNDDRRAIAAETPSREQLGLPQSGFVFCCFNNNYKITPDVFDIWMRLLNALPDSILWLLEDNADAAVNLRSEAQRRGVDPRRLVFAPRTDPPTHLARHRQADLFLDTLPYNAHTTASDALWAGVPVVTRLGSTFPGRVGASLLGAAGLPELITHSAVEYESRALELACDPAQLAALRRRLADQRGTCPLFDTRRFARHLETAFQRIWERRQAGLAPESFSVPAADEA